MQLKHFFGVGTDQSLKVINQTSTGGYLAILVFALSAAFLALLNQYVFGATPDLSIYKVPFVWVHVLYLSYCVWCQLWLKDTLRSLRVFAVCLTLSSSVSIVFGFSGLYSAHFLLFPTLIVILFWVFPRKVALCFTVGIFALAVYSYVALNIKLVPPVRGREMVQFMETCVAVVTTWIMASIISRANEKHFETLDNIIKLRTKELEVAIQSIRENDAKLEQAARLQSLFKFSIGLSHKLNTPVGVIITAVSTLDEELNRIDHAIAANSLKRSRLIDFVGNARGINSLVNKASYDVVRLVEMAKELSEFPAPDQRREFSLREALEVLFLDLRQKNLNGWTLTCEEFEEIFCLTYCDEVQKIVTRLIEMYAFTVAWVAR